MPRFRKKTGRRLTVNAKNEKTLGDVTINDFANSPSAVHVRLKKASTNVSCEVRHIMAKPEENLTWDEKLDDFDEHFKFIEDTDEDCSNYRTLKTSDRNRRKVKTKEPPMEEHSGIDYPLDLWFLISEHISPEAVGKFACICKSSCHVVKSAKFWFHLYKRYYRTIVGLPARLQPECMMRQYGLRACVIRTLHYTYFSREEETIYSRYASQEEEPHSLVKRQCSVMWHKQGKFRWYFYFKLKETLKTPGISFNHIDKKRNRQPSLIEMLEDVSANSEEGCKVLQVTCMKYSMVPLVIGLTLQEVSVNLSPGFDHHRLQLGFSTSYAPKSPSSLVVVLDGVVKIRVFDWWHPSYPHQDMVSAILPPADDS